MCKSIYSNFQTVISKIIWLFKTNHSTILQALLISSGKGTNEVFSVCRFSLFFSYWAGYSPSTIVTAFSCSASAEPFVLIATCQTYRQDTMFICFLRLLKPRIVNVCVWQVENTRISTSHLSSLG